MLAALGGAGLGAVGALLTALMVGQAVLARRSIPAVEGPPPRPDGEYGLEHAGPAVRLVLLGDSAAAGFGADLARNTTGALLAAGLAEQLLRPVHLRCVAVVGAESRHLGPQVEAALEEHPDLAVIIIGGNDVTHRASVSEAVAHLVGAVRSLRAGGADVIVGTCPDLGTIRPILPPLRWLATHWSRQMAAAQTIAVVEAGGRTVSFGDLLGPLFSADPERMFSPDRFHPSAEGYQAAAAALLPTAVAALRGAPERPVVLAANEGVRTLRQAAVEAARQAGTEVSGASVAGNERGPAGRWAQLRHRVWRRTQRPTGPADQFQVRSQAEQRRLSQAPRNSQASRTSQAPRATVD